MSRNVGGRERRGRWWPGLGLSVVFGLLLVGLVLLRVIDPIGDRGTVNVGSAALVFLGLLLWMLWFLFASGQRVWLRLAPWALVLLLFGSFRACYRIEKVSGEMIPTFARRGAPAPSSELVGNEPPSVAGDGVDLLTTGPDDFPGFLGPGGTAAVEHVALARDWEARPPELLWRQPIGAGWSGFAVVNGFALTMEQRGEMEQITCYEAETGKLRWSHGVAASFSSVVPGDGPRATPAVDGGRVYALGATGILTALDGATGGLLWQKDVSAAVGMNAEDEILLLPYGRSNSPLVVDGLVVVPGGGPEEGPRASLLAFDKVTGEEVWRGGDQQISCSTPSLGRIAGRRQILSVNEATASGHDPATGEVLWEHPWPGRTAGDTNASQARALPGDRVFLSKGYGAGASLIQIEAEGSGFQARELWHNRRVLRTKFTNVTFLGSHAYGLSDGILECVDLETGERVWKAGRYRHGQILRAGDLLIVLSEEGEVVLVEAAPEPAHRVLGRIQAIEGKTWNNFALYGDLLLVRNAEEAAAYRLPLVTK